MVRLTAAPGRLGAMPARIAMRPRRSDNFYRSAEWQALVKARRAEGNCWCVTCGTGERLILDHIIEIKDGGARLDPANTQWLCHAHHQAKTAAAKRKRVRGGI